MFKVTSMLNKALHVEQMGDALVPVLLGNKRLSHVLRALKRKEPCGIKSHYRHESTFRATACSKLAAIVGRNQLNAELSG